MISARERLAMLDGIEPDGRGPGWAKRRAETLAEAAMGPATRLEWARGLATQPEPGVFVWDVPAPLLGATS